MLFKYLNNNIYITHRRLQMQHIQYIPAAAAAGYRYLTVKELYTLLCVCHYYRIIKAIAAALN